MNSGPENDIEEPMHNANTPESTPKRHQWRHQRHHRDTTAMPQ